MSWDAAALWGIGTSAATLEQVAGSNAVGFVVSYDDTAVEYRYGTFIVPSNINTGGTVTFSVMSRTKTSGTGNMIWAFGQSSPASGASWDATYTAHKSAATATTASSTTALTITTWSVSVSSLSWAADDLVQFRIYRDSADSSDTVTGDLCLHALRITIPIS